jgi:hypothetical protein
MKLDLVRIPTTLLNNSIIDYCSRPQKEFLRKLEMSGYAENLVLKGGMFLYTISIMRADQLKL